MMSRNEATAIANVFKNTLRDRAQDFLRGRAQAGFVGGVFGISASDTGPIAAAVKAELEGLGWTVVVDLPNFTATIT